MLIVSDTSPITNLIQVDLLHLLPSVYQQITIPLSVYEELCEVDSQKEIIDKQEWIRVAIAQNEELVKSLELELDRGEAEAIALALELKADFLIIDESNGRQKAASLGIDIVGLLGTLIKAKSLGFIPLVRPILDKLIDQIGFYINPQLRRHVLGLAGE